jgi:hypothetical protein
MESASPAQAACIPGMPPNARMLEVSIFHALHSNAHRIDFNVLLLDLMVIAYEVDSQLAQAMTSYTAV